jgi:hypothetical protein
MGRAASVVMDVVWCFGEFLLDEDLRTSGPRKRLGCVPPESASVIGFSPA